jgi:hypothetical protein
MFAWLLITLAKLARMKFLEVCDSRWSIDARPHGLQVVFVELELIRTFVGTFYELKLDQS